MPAAGVVEAIDVLEERLCDLVTGGPTVSPNEFCFERFEEGLDGSVVVAVSPSTHRDLEAQVAQSPLIVMRTILAAPVGVMHAAWWGVAKGYRPVQSLQSQITF